MTDTTTQAAEAEAVRLCKLFGNDYPVAATLRALAAERDAANARADQARDAALVEAAKACNDRGAQEEQAYGLTRGTQNFYRARDVVRALRDKPAPAVPLADLDQHSRDAWAKAAEGAPPTLSAALQLSEVQALVEAVDQLGISDLVSGWNGRGREVPYEPHLPRLGVALKTNAGTVYAIDAALAAIKEPKP